MFYEEDPSASIQLIGTASVRGRMLQLTPGDAFSHLAAQSDIYLPETLGDAALDASARDMRQRLARAAGIATSEPNRDAPVYEDVRRRPAGSSSSSSSSRSSSANAPIFRRYGETLEAFDLRRNQTILARGGDPATYGADHREGGDQCATADSSSGGGGSGGGSARGGGGGGEGGGGRSVKLQGSMNALGELTLETTQTDGSGFAGGHGQLPQTGDRDHPNAVPRNLDQASRERLGGAWDGETVRDDHVGIESLAYFEEQGMLIPRTQSGALNLDWWWPPDEEDERLPDGTRGGTIHPDRARTRLEELAYEATVAKLPPRPLSAVSLLKINMRWMTFKGSNNSLALALRVILLDFVSY